MIALLAALLALPAAAAPQEPVEVPVTGFTAELKDGRVVAKWKRYTRGDLKAYQLQKAEGADPSCGAPPVFSASSPDALSYEDGHLAPGSWRYRLCIVTAFGERWMSPVVSVAIDEEGVRRSPPTVADFE